MVRHPVHIPNLSQIGSQSFMFDLFTLFWLMVKHVSTFLFRFGETGLCANQYMVCFTVSTV